MEKDNEVLESDVFDIGLPNKFFLRLQGFKEYHNIKQLRDATEKKKNVIQNDDCIDSYKNKKSKAINNFDATEMITNFYIQRSINTDQADTDSLIVGSYNSKNYAR